MKPEPGGYFSHTETEIEEGQRYAFRIDRRPERPDPMSRWQPDGVHRPSAVIWPDRFDWSEGDWAGLSRKELVIYELHVGTFTPEGTFDAITGRLEELRELGVTAIELMPVAQFPGTRAGATRRSTHSPSRTATAGRAGCSGWSTPAIARAWPCFWTSSTTTLDRKGTISPSSGPTSPTATARPGVAPINFDGRGCDAVRAFVLENVRYWIRDFHVDGLRLDAVHAIYDWQPAAHPARRSRRPPTTKRPATRPAACT